MHGNISSKLILTSLLLFVILPATDASAKKSAIEANEQLLAGLDSIVDNHQHTIERKEKRIASLRQSLNSLEAPSDKLTVANRLYEEYLVYDSDSALNYATMTGELAQKVNPNDMNTITRWQFNKAYIYSMQGFFDKAMNILSKINISELPNDLKAEYYSIMEYTYSMHSIYMESDKNLWREDMAKSNMYRDSIRKVTDGKEREWLWVPVAIGIDESDYRYDLEAVNRLKESVDNDPDNSRRKAINAYWLSCHYRNIDDEVNMVKYMTIASTADALIENREIAAIQALAVWLFNNGDLNRAYKYLEYSVAQANSYHNRYRMVSLSTVLPVVRDAYRQEIEKRDSRLAVMVWILTIISVILIAAITYIIVEYRKLHRTRQSLSSVNERLKDTVADRDKAISALSEANEELKVANTEKLGVLAYAFRLTTEYINALDDYRRQLLRKYKSKKIDEIGMLLTDPEMIKDQYHSFYECFDRTVLSIFPDFINEYNNNVSEDSRVDAEAIAKSESLNTRLRIHALRRLGVEKSADIARMLNISIRTVYNNRTS